MLFSQTEPIIEASNGIEFTACRSYWYPEVYDQMLKSNLSQWNNKWTDVFDFSKNKLANDKANFTIKPTF